MHIAEGFLPPVHCAVWFAAAAPAVGYGARAVVRQTRESPHARLLLGAGGAFTLVLSAIKLPSLTGSSSHPTGTGLGAILFRPPAMAFLGTVVLVFQALLLAHGGLSTLGANAFAFAVVGPWAAYGMLRLAGRLRAPQGVAVFLAMATANLATYLTTAAQLALAYPDPASGYAGALAKFAGIFAVTQVPLAVVEGLLGVAVVGYLTRVAGMRLAGRSTADSAAVAPVGAPLDRGRS